MTYVLQTIDGLTFNLNDQERNLIDQAFIKGKKGLVIQSSYLTLTNISSIVSENKYLESKKQRRCSKCSIVYETNERHICSKENDLLGLPDGYLQRALDGEQVSVNKDKLKKQMQLMKDGMNARKAYETAFGLDLYTQEPIITS